MLQVSLFQDVRLWLYFIHALVSGVSHGLGLGLGLSHTVELWFWCLQGPSLSLGGYSKFYSPGIYAYGDTLLMVWCQGYRPQSRVRVMVLAHCRVMALVFAGS